MRIPCYFDNRFEPPAPFIKAMLESRALGFRKPVCFHVDTGASATILLDKDICYLRIIIERLRKSERRIGGIGGLVQTCVIEDAVCFLERKAEK
ncbi:MAG: hypothetical protein FGF50_01540 [Candidatus Brockarchaeota archaeon]|nr:hypothetical protein [Candidatus Brockarchaeota archaeon]